MVISLFILTLMTSQGLWLMCEVGFAIMGVNGMGFIMWIGLLPLNWAFELDF